MSDVIKTICICGAGTMGAGIAEVFALAGYKTILFDINAGVLLNAQNTIENDFEKLVQRSKLSVHEKIRAWEALYFTSNINDCKAHLVIEAIIENIDAKISAFKTLAQINPNAILTSNTSSLPLTLLAEALENKNRFAGLHFFNPAPVMKLVEIIRTNYTSDETLQQLQQLVNSLHKTPVVCCDSPGFIVNRIARPFYIEALRLAETGNYSYETIDRLMQSRGFKMGPFRLMDLIGNDVNFAVSNSVYDQLGKPTRLKPSYLQEENVKKGRLGKKTGKGFYDYKP